MQMRKAILVIHDELFGILEKHLCKKIDEIIPIIEGIQDIDSTSTSQLCGIVVAKKQMWNSS